MSDTDPTPDTPVTVGDRMGWFRGDVAAKIAAILGTPASDLATLTAKLNILNDYAENIGINAAACAQSLAENQYRIYERLDQIAAVLGAGPYSSTETANIRALLLSLLQATNQQLYGAAPSVASDVQSDRNAVVSGRRYAQFDPPIPGVTIASNGYDLTCASWSGWSAYVQTNAPRCQMLSEEDSPNTWLDLVGTGTINFSVDAAYNITVHLRRPEGSEYWYTSQLLSAITQPPGSYHMIVWSSAEGGQLSSPTGANRWGARVYRYGSFVGYRLRVVEGGSVSFDAYVGQYGTTVTLSGSWFTVTGNVSCMVLYSTDPFTVAVEPPSGS